jgi:hypothetical protein
LSRYYSKDKGKNEELALTSTAIILQLILIALRLIRLDKNLCSKLVKNGVESLDDAVLDWRETKTLTSF